MTRTNGSDGRVTTVSGEDDREIPVRTVEELDAQLDRLDAEARQRQPLAAEIVRPDGVVLIIGLGRDESVLNYQVSEAGPYYTSHSEDAPDDSTVVFYYGGHESEFLAEAAVPVEDAREAARLFFADGKRPENIDWQQD
jgi:immunity protein Imm1 of predicted polymorphic toxin system